MPRERIGPTTRPDPAIRCFRVHSGGLPGIQCSRACTWGGDGSHAWRGVLPEDFAARAPSPPSLFWENPGFRAGSGPASGGPYGGLGCRRITGSLCGQDAPRRPGYSQVLGLPGTRVYPVADISGSRLYPGPSDSVHFGPEKASAARIRGPASSLHLKRY